MVYTVSQGRRYDSAEARKKLEAVLVARAIRRSHDPREYRLADETRVRHAVAWGRWVRGVFTVVNRRRLEVARLLTRYL
jgi:hypothetical protein